MSKVLVSRGMLKGSVQVPASKSAAHRAILCAALAKGTSRLSNLSENEDIEATISAVRALGAVVEKDGSALIVDGTNTGKAKTAAIDCNESGSTLRFLIPVAAALGIKTVFTGAGRLPVRPQKAYMKLLPQKGVELLCKKDVFLPLTVKGQLQSGVYEVGGDVSSQFISGLLFALPLLKGNSETILTTPLQSAGYVQLTLEQLEQYGIEIEKTENGYRIPGAQSYKACDLALESDWSQAAFFLAAGALGGDVTCIGLNKDSAQGDKKIVSLLKQMGADIAWQKDGSLHCQSNGSLYDFEVNASQIPDLVPILSVLAAFADGTTLITGARRLRYKESDRLSAMADNLARMGIDVQEQEDGLVISGTDGVTGKALNGYKDHRIVMAMSIAAAKLFGDEPLTITDAHSINKSYPNFFEQFNRLGGDAHVV